MSIIRLIEPEAGVTVYPEVSRSPGGHDLCNCQGSKDEVEQLSDIRRPHHTLKIMRDHPTR